VNRGATTTRARCAWRRRVQGPSHRQYPRKRLIEPVGCLEGWLDVDMDGGQLGTTIFSARLPTCHTITLLWMCLAVAVMR
jgi:hypothetical protein